MDVDALSRAWPTALESAGIAYALADDLVARHGQPPSPDAVVRLEGDDVSVEPLAAVAGRGVSVDDAGPVYRQVPSGGLAVPTGRIFVRFGEGDKARRHEASLARAGFHIEDVPAYAVHAAWLRADTGSIADALLRFSALRRIPGVEHVEPQLLRVPAHRTDR